MSDFVIYTSAVESNNALVMRMDSWVPYRLIKIVAEIITKRTVDEVSRDERLTKKIIDFSNTMLGAITTNLSTGDRVVFAYDKGSSPRGEDATVRIKLVAADGKRVKGSATYTDCASLLVDADMKVVDASAPGARSMCKWLAERTFERGNRMIQEGKSVFHK